MSCNDHNISLFAFFTHLDELRTLPPIHEDLRKICNVPMLGKLLAMTSPTEAVYWLRARMYIWVPSQLALPPWRPDPAWEIHATKGDKKIESFGRICTSTYTILYTLNTLFKKAPQTVAACIHQMIASDWCCKVWPWSWKVCERNTFEAFAAFAFHWFHSEWCPDHVNIMCVYWNPSDSSSPENLWPQHHLGHLKSLRAQGLRSRVKHLAGRKAPETPGSHS